MDLHDKDMELDMQIRSALQVGTNVSYPKRNHAWKEIQHKAARQRILAPVEVKERLTFFECARLTGRQLWNWATTLAVDEAQYERAHQNHFMMRYGGPSRDGRLVLQVMNPFGFQYMSPAM